MCAVAVFRRAGKSAEVKLVDYHCTVPHHFIVMYNTTCMIVLMFADAYGQHVQHQHAWFYR